MPTTTYTIREPGHSYWATTTSKREARRQWRAARDEGLARVRVYRDRDGELDDVTAELGLADVGGDR